MGKRPDFFLEKSTSLPTVNSKTPPELRTSSGWMPNFLWRSAARLAARG
jgi:hypothetical protein